MRGLALSGGAARGSFQVGALEFLYKELGYRPDVIASTSVGSVNALAIAQGDADEQLAQLNKLLAIWRGLSSPTDFYMLQPWVAQLLRSDGLDLSGGLNVRQEDAIVELLFNNLLGNATISQSLAVLTPLELKIRTTPGLYSAAKLAGGVPLRMVTVSLETGRVRYVTGRGLFLEDDNFTPVASALPRVAAIIGPHDTFTSEVASIRTLMDTIETESKRHWDDRRAKWRRIVRLRLDLERARWRAEEAFDQLATANASLPIPIQATVDPVKGVLASSGLPGIFEPVRIGEELYVDGGVRENVPVRAAIQMGATEVIAIACSSQNMPKAGYAGRENFLSNLLTGLANIALKELVEDDLAGRGVESSGVPVTVIIPNFDVHDGAVVDTGLIHISMAYGYMRAADVIAPVDANQRRGAFLLSDAITNIRKETHLLANLWIDPFAPDAHEMLLELRLRKWIIRRLTEARIASGVGVPEYATQWFQGWEFGSSGVPNIPNPWQYFTTSAQTTPAVDPFSYVPDDFVYEEVGDLTGLYIIRAGACFRSTAARIGAVTAGSLTPDLTLPRGATANLPSVPVAGTVLAEAAPAGESVQTSGNWIVDGRRRYLLDTAAAAALGTTPSVTQIPVGGLAQIPVGGTPYWLGGLVIADSQPALIHRWEPTPQAETNRSPTAVILWNRSSRTVNVTDVRITTPKDTVARRMFTMRTALPFTIAAGQTFMVNVDFDAFASGPLDGEVAVDCDDPISPQIRLPLGTFVTPLGGHADLVLNPSQVDLGATIVATTVGQEVTIRNTGVRSAGISATIDEERPAGQFAVSTYSLINPLPAGQSTRVYVSFTPTMRGTARATLVIAMSSDTDIPIVKYQHRYDVPLAGSATAPVMMLAAGPRQTRPRPIPRPDRFPVDPTIATLERPPLLQEPELATLDFGTATVNSLTSKSFWIRNIGDAPLTVRDVLSYAQMSFGVNDLSVFPLTLQPGGEVEIPSNFNAGPVPGGTSRSQFAIQSDDPHRPSALLNLIGRASGPHLTGPSELLDLGPVSAPATATLTFTSDGSDPVRARSIELRNGQDFALSAVPAVPATLAPADTLVVTVTFTAATPGDYQDQLELVHDGLPSGSSSVLLRATAI